MEATTLITFLFNTKPQYRTIELFGSWDNFNLPYRMHHDRRRGNGVWSGCFQFENIIFDGGRSEGDDTQLAWSRPRTGGLKQGGTYWYYYRMNYEQDAYDDRLPFTNDCPLMPGQTVNILEVPIEQIRLPPRCRTAHADITTSSKVNRPELQARAQSLDPASKYAKLNPPPFSKLYKNCKSDHALSGRLESVPALILEEERRAKSERRNVARKTGKLTPLPSRQASGSAHSKYSEVSLVSESSRSGPRSSRHDSTDMSRGRSAPGSAPISFVCDDSDEHVAILVNAHAEQERGLSSRAKHVLKPEYPYPNVLGASPLTSIDLLAATLFPCEDDIDDLEPNSPRVVDLAETPAVEERRDSGQDGEVIASIVAAASPLRLAIPSRESDAVSLQNRPKSAGRQDSTSLASPPRPDTTISSSIRSTIGDSPPTQQRQGHPDIYSQPNLTLQGAPSPIRPQLCPGGRAAARHSYPGCGLQLLMPQTTAALVSGNVISGRRGSAIDFSRHRRLHQPHESPAHHRDSAGSSAMLLTPTFSACTISTSDGPRTPMTTTMFNPISTFGRLPSPTDEIDFDIDINNTTALDMSTVTALEKPISPKQLESHAVPRPRPKTATAATGDRTVGLVVKNEDLLLSPDDRKNSIASTAPSSPSSYRTTLDDMLTSTPKYSFESPQVARESFIERIASYASVTTATAALAETVFISPPGAYPPSLVTETSCADLSASDTSTIEPPSQPLTHPPSPTRLPPPPPVPAPTPVPTTAPPAPPTTTSKTTTTQITTTPLPILSPPLPSSTRDYTTMHPAFRPRTSQPTRPPPATPPPPPPASASAALRRTTSSVSTMTAYTYANTYTYTTSKANPNTSASASRLGTGTGSESNLGERAQLQNMIVFGAEDDDDDDDDDSINPHSHSDDEDYDDQSLHPSALLSSHPKGEHSSSSPSSEEQTRFGDVRLRPQYATVPSPPLLERKIVVQHYDIRAEHPRPHHASISGAVVGGSNGGIGNDASSSSLDYPDDEEDLLFAELGYLGESIIC